MEFNRRKFYSLSFAALVVLFVVEGRPVHDGFRHFDEHGRALAALDEIIGINDKMKILHNPGEDEVVDGDMKLLGEMKKLYEDRSKHQHGRERRELIEPEYLWPRAELVYEYQADAASILRGPFESAMNAIRAVSCVTFKQRTTETAYLQVILSSGCWSSVGTGGGMSQLSLGYGCHSTKTATHELLHALGMYHEHQRTDRDAFVTVNYANVNPAYTSAFAKILPEYHRPLGYGYDYLSIMHYGNYAFASNYNSMTITLNSNPSATVGGVTMSPTDIAQLNAMYCGGTQTTATTTATATTTRSTAASTTTSSTTNPTAASTITASTTPASTTTASTTRPTTTATTTKPTAASTTAAPTTQSTPASTTPASTTRPTTPATTTQPTAASTTAAPTTQSTPASTTRPTTTATTTKSTAASTTAAATTRSTAASTTIASTTQSTLASTTTASTTRATTASTTTRPATTGIPESTDHPVCQDTNMWCYLWTYRGYCNHPDYMAAVRADCPMSCNCC